MYITTIGASSGVAIIGMLLVSILIKPSTKQTSDKLLHQIIREQ